MRWCVATRDNKSNVNDVLYKKRNKKINIFSIYDFSM